MKSILQTSLFAAILLTLSSFVNHKTADFIGVYGVSENDLSGIELTLNGDRTFTYKDFSNPSKKIDTHGNWELKNNHIRLVNFTSEYSFHSKWKIIKEGMAAKSRKGLTFYTLSKKCK
jgi:hypothetical protein